ncbi:MAG TPA: TA system VapC family ribonuclease toxin [Spirochaetia bacterium]|nr:TA system VapC family ribonuclease toxin [Spirochaetia bacterium]
MTALLDVNFLVALAWPNHVHHAAAATWFTAHSGAGWASCAITEMGFVRVSSNPAIVDEAVKPSDAIALLAQLVAVGDHQFWTSEVALTMEPQGFGLLIVGHRQVTDAYLLALAARHNGLLVTFDQRIENLIPVASTMATHVEVIRT